MKKLALVIVLALVFTVPAFAQLGDTDNSSFVIQNLGTGDSQVTVTFYDESGTAYSPNPILPGGNGVCGAQGAPDGDDIQNPFTLGANGAKQEIYMPAVCALGDGRYSVVIESTEPVGVIANLLGQTGGGAPYYSGSYSGFDASDDTVYFPSTQYEFYNWNSLMSIQNTTADPINVNLYIYDEAGVQKALKVYNSVPAFSSVHLDLETEGAGLLLPPGLNGSAKAVCTGACVGTDNQTADGGYTVSYSGFLGGDNALYAPGLYYSYYTWDSSLKVQNIGTVAANIDVLYKLEDGTTCNPPSEVIQPNQSLYHYLPARWAGWGCGTHNNLIIGAVVTSDQLVVGVANAANPATQAQTYSAIAVGSGADTVGLPVIMNNYYGWDTAFVCQNLDASNSATVNYSYSGIGCPGGGCSYSLLPGQAKSVYQPGDGGLGGNTGLFAVTVTATGAPVACIANQTLPDNQTGTMGDWSMSYNGFGQ